MSGYEGPLSNIRLLTTTIAVGSTVTYTNTETNLDVNIGKVEVPIIYAKATATGTQVLTGTMGVSYSQRVGAIPYLPSYSKTITIPSFDLVNGTHWGIIALGSSTMFDRISIGSITNSTSGTMVTLEVGVTGIISR